MTPKMMAPGTLRAASPAISRNPATASRTFGCDRSPRVTRVVASPATMPAFCKPIRARNSPMPAAMPSFRFIGIALISHSRSGVSEIKKEQHAGQEHAAERELPAAAELRHHGEGEIGVEAHARRERDRVVGVEAHDRAARRGGKTGGDEHGAMIHAGLFQDRRVHEHDVGHGEEGGDAGAKLGGDARPRGARGRRSGQRKPIGPLA